MNNQSRTVRLHVTLNELDPAFDANALDSFIHWPLAMERLLGRHVTVLDSNHEDGGASEKVDAGVSFGFEVLELRADFEPWSDTYYDDGWTIDIETRCALDEHSRIIGIEEINHGLTSVRLMAASCE